MESSLTGAMNIAGIAQGVVGVGLSLFSTLKAEASRHADVHYSCD